MNPVRENSAVLQRIATSTLHEFSFVLDRVFIFFTRPCCESNLNPLTSTKHVNFPLASDMTQEVQPDIIAANDEYMGVSRVTGGTPIAGWFITFNGKPYSFLFKWFQMDDLDWFRLYTNILHIQFIQVYIWIQVKNGIWKISKGFARANCNPKSSIL